MTIFDLLDRLETTIFSLLPSAATAEKSKAAKRSSVKRKRTRTGGSMRQRAKIPAQVEANGHRDSGEQLAHSSQVSIDQEAGKPDEPARQLGKRQALGRSLLQLRKLSVNRTEDK